MVVEGKLWGAAFVLFLILILNLVLLLHFSSTAQLYAQRVLVSDGGGMTGT